MPVDPPRSRQLLAAYCLRARRFLFCCEGRFRDKVDGTGGSKGGVSGLFGILVTLLEGRVALSGNSIGVFRLFF